MDFERNQVPKFHAETVYKNVTVTLQGAQAIGHKCVQRGGPNLSAPVTKIMKHLKTCSHDIKMGYFEPINLTFSLISCHFCRYYGHFCRYYGHFCRYYGHFCRYHGQFSQYFDHFLAILNHLCDKFMKHLQKSVPTISKGDVDRIFRDHGHKTINFACYIAVVQQQETTLLLKSVGFFSLRLFPPMAKFAPFYLHDYQQRFFLPV